MTVMRRLLTPGSLVSMAIIVAVATMVAVANMRDVRRSRALLVGFGGGR